jgi:hypothetical protein
MKKAKPRIVELDARQIEAALAQAKAALPEPTYQVLATIVEAYRFVLEQLARKRASIGRLRRMLFGPTSEKTRELLKQAEADRRCPPSAEPAPRPRAKKPRPPGHGRNGASDYRQAEIVAVPHGKLQSGDRCPHCRKGKVYEQGDPGVLVRMRGQAPVDAKIYELEKLRCNLCGEIFTARPPEGVGAKKYDETTGSMVALLKYGSGVPFNRLDRLQGRLGLPLPAATQWEIVSAATRPLEPAYEELVRQAAQGKVLHNDDTGMKILAWMGSRREQQESDRVGPKDSKGERTGVFTSGIVSVAERWRIALFLTGHRHAGENLETVLQRRAANLGRPIQMCDALSRNVPATFKTFLANCLAHGRRRFADVLENFPAECGYVLKLLRKVYIYDAIARRRGMTPAERLRYHQKKSGPVMEKLHNWMELQLAEKRVEPNSGLGEAISYMLGHWEQLTLFLRRAGAPLDNNIVERALKKAILHRKNALFYKTDNGARVGDLYMSLIHTCEMNGADPFDYLTQVQRHAKDVREHPERWMPWNYQKALPHVRSP